MNMSVKEPFTLFKSENPSVKISKSKFYQLRPKNVQLTCEMPHNVCVCKYHANFYFIVETVHKKDSSFPKNNTELMPKVCCNIEDEKCMTGSCENCKSQLQPLMDRRVDISTLITWKKRLRT